MMKGILKSIALISVLAALIGCSQGNQSEKPLVLSTDIVEIAPDGNQLVTFTVKRSIDDVTSSCTIYNKESNQPIDGYTFSSTTEGTFTFFATNGSENSNEVVISVRENPLGNLQITLIPDGDTIYADNQERVSFRVMCNDEDVSSSSELYLVCPDSEYDTRLMEFIFSTDIIGIHNFYAVYFGATSEIVPIVATERPPQIVLCADKYSIIADGSDTATFTVTVNDEDVTESAEFYLIMSEEEEAIKLEANTFTSKIEGTFLIYASTPQGNSNTIEIVAETPAAPEE